MPAATVVEMNLLEVTRVVKASQLETYYGRPAPKLTTAEIGFWLWMQSEASTRDEEKRT